MSLLAVVVIPLIDVRAFVGADTGRIRTPTWPVQYFPEEKQRFPFIRGFGQVCERPLGGGLEWSSEGAFADVSHGLRFSRRFLADRPQLRTGALRAYCAFRRLYWDGLFKAGVPGLEPASIVGRIEVGFVLRRTDGSPIGLNGTALHEMLDSMLTHECYLLSKRTAAAAAAAERFALIVAGTRVAGAYLRATTKTKMMSGADEHLWWVGAGSPMTILKTDDPRDVEVPPGALMIQDPVLTGSGTEVSLHRQPVLGLKRPVWIVRHEHLPLDLLRRLRINLGRVHSEVAGLRWITNVVTRGQLKPPPRSTADDMFQRYLDSAVRYLSKDTFNGIANFELVRAAIAALDVPSPRELQTLRETIEHIRPATLDRVTTLGTKLKAAETWDFFIAHAGADKAAAEDLYSRLTPAARTFLDTQELRPGDDWTLELLRAQRRSLITVVLLSSRTESAFYQRDEIVRAVQMMRDNPETHRVIPVHLNDVADAPVFDYGLKPLHALFVTSESGLDAVASALITTLTSLRQRRATDPMAA